MALELERVLGAMLRAMSDATVLLIGRNSERFKQRYSLTYPEHAGRVAATGEIGTSEVAHRLRACDFVVQPYPDGATTRRTSLMASLACGVPTVTTIGVWSEPLWRAAREAIELAPAGDVASIVDRCQRLANDPVRRGALGVAGRAFYERNFTIERTLRTLCGADDTDPSVLVGVHAHPATGETARRQRDALAAIAALDGVLRVNLQFASPDTPPIEVDGFETQRVLESDSNQVTGRLGTRKPIASEMFDLLARRALEEGCAYFAYVNSDTVLSQGAVERIGGGGADAYLLARTDTGNGRPPGILLSGMDGFAINAFWWVTNRWRFRPYPVGEPVWDCVYSAKLACHGRASIVYSLGALTHERHETAWVSSPFAQYVQYLSALDAPYFSLWCRYYDRLMQDVEAGMELDGAAAIAAETFVWRPSAFARAVQASRRLKGWVRYVAESRLPDGVDEKRVMRILLVGDFPDDPTLGSSKVPHELRQAFTRLGHHCDALFANDLGARPRQRHARDLLGPSLAARAIARAFEARGPYDVVDVAGAEGAAFRSLRKSGITRGAALVSRSNGLEHLNYERLLEDARAGLGSKPWPRRVWYPAVRLRQVRRAIAELRSPHPHQRSGSLVRRRARMEGAGRDRRHRPRPPRAIPRGASARCAARGGRALLRVVGSGEGRTVPRGGVACARGGRWRTAADDSRRRPAGRAHPRGLRPFLPPRGHRPRSRRGRRSPASVPAGTMCSSCARLTRDTASSCPRR